MVFMRNLFGFVLFAVGALSPSAAISQDLYGAGATLPLKAYLKWGEGYAAQGGKALKYDGVGSGAGVQAIRERKADFGASDIPLKAEELESAKLRQFPTSLSAIVPVVNLAGVAPNALNLDGATLADLMSGKITSWDDPAIAKLNPALKLPKLRVVVLYRAERSGSTALLSSFLTSASPAWKSAIGEGQELKWPVGSAVKGTSGMAEAVAKTSGSIGYIDYADAVSRGLSTVTLRNQFNFFVSAGSDTIRGATKFAEWKKHQFDEDPTFDVSLINQPGNKVWPIVTATYVILPKERKSVEKNKEVLKLFSWALDSGDDALLKLGYIPLPDSVKSMVKNSWKRHFLQPNAS